MPPVSPLRFTTRDQTRRDRYLPSSTSAISRRTRAVRYSGLERQRKGRGGKERSTGQDAAKRGKQQKAWPGCMTSTGKLRSRMQKASQSSAFGKRSRTQDLEPAPADAGDLTGYAARPSLGQLPLDAVGDIRTMESPAQVPAHEHKCYEASKNPA